MKDLVLFFLFVLTFPAQAVSIEGKWRSSGDLTNSYNFKNAVLDEKQREFFSQLIGSMVVEFRDGVSTMYLPTITVSISGEESEFEGFTEVEGYKVIASDKNTVVLETKDHEGSKLISTYHFVDDDTMWVYVAGQSDIFPEINIREYFVRCK